MNHPLITKALSGDKQYSAKWSVFQNSILLQVWENGLARQDAHLTLDDFAHVHPLLPGALWATMASNLGNIGSESCYDEEVRGALAYLNGATVAFTDADGQACLMYALESISLNRDNLVNVSGHVITVETCDYGLQQVPYVTTCTHCTMQVEPAEMSMRYPGWEKRLNVGEGLSLEQTELVRFVFSGDATSSANPDLVMITFD